MSYPRNRRVLLVDDTSAIHADFAKVLQRGTSTVPGLAHARDAFFGTPDETPPAGIDFELEFAFQGDEALAKVVAARQADRRYALAFVDVRMPPGWDGIETISRLWKEDPDLQIVICSAYADYSWKGLLERLGQTDRLLILKKPFDPIEVNQLALALSEKWSATMAERARVEELRSAEQEARAYAASVVAVNRELIAARAAAIAAGVAKSQFLANMSHELRTPMIAILGHADLLSDAGQSAEQRLESLDTIRGNGRRLLGLVDDVLDLAALESGELRVERQLCPVAEILEDVRVRFAAAAHAKGLSFQVECAQGTPAQILSDRARVRQLVCHLVDNAVKFTDQGGVKISVTTNTTTDSGGEEPTLLLGVEDTGMGISAEHRAQMFEAFSQADGSLTRRHGGTGLGLALCRRLASVLGASIDFVSEPGRGTCFSLTLPIGEILDSGERELSSVPARKDEPVHVRGRVLLVEDVQVTQRLMALYLRRAGADVDVAGDGQAALDCVEQACTSGRPFDLVLMDMQMPVLDGYSATRSLRARGHTLPVIAVTAHAMAGDRERCLDAGCDDYLAKPIERRELLEHASAGIARGLKPALPAAKPSALVTPPQADRAE